VTSALQWRIRDPTLFLGFDEQQHMRTLEDIQRSHELFHPSPVLEISPRYPGLEVLATFFHQLGLPLMAAATTVVLLAKLVMVLVLCDAVEQLTGSVRAGGIAVAMYSCTAQFVAWDSMFAYETLGLPLAVGSVALVARARTRDDPRLLLAAATICLMAVAIIHHVTSFMTAAFFVAWTLFEPGRARWRVLIGAIASVGSTALWIKLNYWLVEYYFSQYMSRLMANTRENGMRTPFSNAAKYTTPLWERLVILDYAVTVASIAAALTLIWMRPWWGRIKRGKNGKRRTVADESRWRPRTFLILPVAMIPLLMATRAVPGLIEISNRMNTFLFLPLSLLVGDGMVRFLRKHPHWYALRFRALVVLLATGTFVGGYLLSSGPGFARLQGPYLPSAEGRSMDAEVLAAVSWAHDNLPAGSRIIGDRVGALLMGSRAGLWPISGKGDLVVAPIYFADEWTHWEAGQVRDLQIRYLYVDRRLSDGLPMVGAYFSKNEGGQQLTPQQLSKFESARGLRTVYRHGPISIYNVENLGIDVRRDGLVGQKEVNIPVQLAGGILIGLLSVLGSRVGIGNFVRRTLRSFRDQAGYWLTAAIAISTICLVWTALLAAGIWVSLYFYVSAGVVALLVHPVWPTKLLGHLGRYGRRLSVGLVVASTLVAIPVAATIALAIADAAAINVTKVQNILNDPASIHVPEQ
jgi:hypothetical protein